MSLFPNTFQLYLKTIIKLGLANVTYIIWYRFTIKSGIRKYFFRQMNFIVNEDFFHPCLPHSDFPSLWKTPLMIAADKILQGEIRYYGYHWKAIGNPPNWFQNVFNNKFYPDSHLHWTKLPDFHPEAGDIKNVWEASRFEWVVTLARAYAVSGKSAYLQTLNSWLKDWAFRNPLNSGPNWKCGQEASIRLFNLINTIFILKQSEKPSKVLEYIVNAHLQRISSNIRYALAQDNNHGTSEAAALFIAGNWLNKASKKYSNAKNYADTGRKWLENRLAKLVEDDGSFSQHSTTYHRVLLDTLIFVEIWRQKLELQAFSNLFYSKSKMIIEWLWLLTDETSGNCPNLGSNDGSLFLNTNSCDYRDFRPTLQTASAIFNYTRYYPKGPWDESLFWLGEQPNNVPVMSTQKFSKVLKGGYVILSQTSSWSLLRFPHYRFRPSHNDVFHFDLWHKCKNIIHDCGSFSYNPSVDENNFDFKSVHAHNTVSFDGFEQMPRLSRFLLGNWIKPDEIGSIKNYPDGGQSWIGSYTDGNKNSHRRNITFRDNIWIIEDELSGNFQSATIGFNFMTEQLSINDSIIGTSWGEINLSPNLHFEIKPGFASDYYWEKHFTNRLVIQLNNSQECITTISLKE